MPTYNCALDKISGSAGCQVGRCAHRRRRAMDHATLIKKHAAIQTKKRALETEAQKRFGRMAAKAGLHNIGLDEERLLAGLRGLAEQFKDAQPSKFALAMKRLEQRERRLLKEANGDRVQQRRNNAREKFLLGGLVVKSGLSDADRGFILGGLC